MALPGIQNFTVVDGSLSLSTEDFKGIKVVIGPANAGLYNTIFSFNSAQDAVAVLNGGRLVNAIGVSLDIAGGPIYAMRMQTSVAGSIGTQIKSLISGSDGALATTGSNPVEDNDVIISMTRAGKVGTAPYPAFTYSLDGGITVSDEIAVPVAGTYNVPQSGIVLVFSNGAAGFKAGDSFRFTTVAASWNNTDLSNALAAVLADSTRQYEFVHIIGAQDATLASTVASYMTIAETNERDLHAICEVRDMRYLASLDTTANTFPMTFAGTEVLKIQVSTDFGLTFPTTQSITVPAAAYASAAALAAALNTSAFTGGLFTVTSSATLIQIVFISDKGKVVLKVDNTSTAIGGALLQYTGGQIGQGELEDAWMTSLQTTFASFVSPRVELVAGHADIFSSVARRYVRESGAWLVSGRTSLVPVSEDLGAVERGPLPLIVTPDTGKGIYGIYHDEDSKYGLDPARFTTLRKHKGLKGFYITQGRTFANAGSDYMFIQYRRVMDQASHYFRIASKKYINKRVQVNPNGTLYIVDRQDIEREIRSYISTNLQGEILDVQVVVDPNEVILQTQKLKIDVAILPYGYSKYLSLRIGYAPVQNVVSLV